MPDIIPLLADKADKGISFFLNKGALFIFPMFFYIFVA